VCARALVFACAYLFVFMFVCVCISVKTRAHARGMCVCVSKPGHRGALREEHPERSTQRGYPMCRIPRLRLERRGEGAMWVRPSEGPHPCHTHTHTHTHCRCVQGCVGAVYIKAVLRRFQCLHVPLMFVYVCARACGVVGVVCVCVCVCVCVWVHV
jgi:hypothetical protein